MNTKDDQPEFARNGVNLASPRLGSAVLHASDDFFADKARLLDDKPAVFVADKYDDNGKWMDGWESRRRRGGGHDHCTIKLGVKGRIHGVDIDTSHFTGNYPPAASLEAALADDPLSDKTAWKEIVPSTALGPSAHHYIRVEDAGVHDCLRLHIYPDGGVARLRVYGEPVAQWDGKDRDAVYELSNIVNGGRILAYNDAHYGSVWTLLLAGRGINMGDGWETRRRREPGNDWIIVRLGAPGTVEKIEVDTAHYKGNYPDRCSVQAALLDAAADQPLATQSMSWQELMGEQKLEMDRIHAFEGKAIRRVGPVSHVKLNIFPDGGVSRLRIFGRLA
ncbi:MAG: allantoicase [Pseudomonadota bacterium]|nr:allantoicase [Pseudomonadota bacterium]